MLDNVSGVELVAIMEVEVLNILLVDVLSVVEEEVSSGNPSVLDCVVCDVVVGSSSFVVVKVVDISSVVVVTGVAVGNGAGTFVGTAVGTTVGPGVAKILE